MKGYMKKFKMKQLIIGFIAAGTCAAILLLIEFKYFIKESEELVPGEISLFVCQFALFFFFFQAIPLFCIGVVQYYRTRGKLAISFVLWAIAMWLLEYVLMGIGTVS